ncbi:Serpentine Receptor, class T [Caenorhabditis elegans]|uniref:Serpentine Receptor, class T n=1 Tax=Caenorhabditis elegans TaxID=6239 RepID=G5EGM5_CAEEL|nr:Serpentine Receptor, class T [Caenorhabditis elegans]CBG22738.1 Serpentine Receptor, class T [Caenorhabditis elegans]|eukprot:NP_001256371.1 Uncharacterized protein CELE_D2023.1 [Caenorhabditis elegans]
MGSFYLRETGEIRDVYKIFLLVECPFHIVNIFLLLICPNFIFSSKTLVNLNLKMTIASYFLAGVLMSMSRLAWLICDLFWVPINTMEILMYSRFVFQTSIAAHLFVFSIERAIATCLSKRYEQNSSYPVIILSCILTYPYSLIQLYSKYNFEKGREINVVMYGGAGIVSLIILLVVYRVNKKKVKERRFKGPISEAYQVRENIRTSRLLIQIFFIFAFFVGTSTFFLLKFSASLTDPSQKWTTIKNGFMYDILICIGTTCTTTVFLQFLIPDDTLKKWRLKFHLSCQQRSVTPEGKRLRFRSIHGIDVEVGNGTAEEEARVYFTQLSQAWKL